MTLAKCSVCGHITHDFVVYGSLALMDEFPSQCPHVCASGCKAVATDFIDKGRWVLPKLKRSCGGYAHDISKKRKGYDAQPPQEELIRELVERTKHPRF